MDEKFLKKYEIIFFVTLLVFFIFELLNTLLNIFEFFQGYRLIKLIIIVAMFVVWFNLKGNKELTKFELIMFIMSYSYVFGLALILLLSIGLFSELIFGIPVTIFLVGIFMTFFIVGLLVLFYTIFKNSKNQEKGKTKIYRYDIYIIVIALAIVLAVIGIYFIS